MSCRKVKEIQEKLLLTWIHSNSSTSYGQAHKFSEISSVDDFKKSHPLTQYQHYEKYVNGIYQGQTKVMTSVEPYILAMTSGTSG